MPVQLEGGWTIGDAAHVNNRQLQRNPNLLRRQADAFGGVHGFEHVRGKLLDLRRNGFDPRAFDPPLPPTTDEPLPAEHPTRRLVRTEVAGQAVEIPSPPTTIGGSWIPSGPVSETAASSVMRIVHRGPVAKAASFIDRLKGGASIAGREPAGAPGVVLLERPETPEDPALMILYVALAPQEVKVNVTP